MKVNGSKENNFSLFDDLMEGCQIIGFNWKYIYLNKTACIHSHRSKEELVGKSYLEIWPGIEKTNVFKLIKDCLDNRTTHQIENLFEYEDGKNAWFNIAIKPIAEGVLILSVDITELKKGNEKLIYLQELLNKMGAVARIGGWEFDVKTGKGTWTDEIAKIHDLDPDAETNVEIGLSFYSGESRIIIEKAIREAIESGKSYDLELEITSAKGVHKWVNTIGRPVIKNGKVIKLHGSLQDITKRKLIEEKIKQSEILNKTLVSHLPQKIFIKDKESVYISCNNNYAKDLGISQKDIIGKTDFDFFPYEFASSYQKDDLEVISKGIIKDLEENYLLHGKVIYNHTIKVPFRDSKNNIIGVLGVFEDITERKKAEHEVKRSVQLLRLFVEHSPASIAMFDLKMNYIVASKRYNIDYNLGDQDLVGHSHYEIFPEIQEQWKEIHKRCLAGETIKELEDPFPRADGKFDWVRWEIRPWYETPEEIGGIILFSEVITERKVTKDALQESNDYNRLLFDKSVIGLTINQMDGKLVDVNQAYANIIGRTIEETLQLTYWDITPEKYNEQEQDLLESLKTIGRYGPYEKEYIHKNGHFVPVSLKGNIIERKGEKYIWSSVEDITKRIEANKLLSSSENKFKALVEQSLTGIYIFEKEKFIYVNSRFCEIFGYSEEEIFANMKPTDVISIDDRERADGNIKKR